ncbi:hypothetical protein RJ640_027851 [Escallonia rubra]|uniref:DNA-directed RNA polymerase subunit n=1 Tax=Escallonia rubra TaxID=112253 RepID=A0AA88RM03_9ASTE|nr:hypothetical protein RJ640_027851 [Escallonia rubra]
MALHRVDNIEEAIQLALQLEEYLKAMLSSQASQYSGDSNARNFSQLTDRRVQTFPGTSQCNNAASKATKDPRENIHVPEEGESDAEDPLERGDVPATRNVKRCLLTVPMRRIRGLLPFSTLILGCLVVRSLSMESFAVFLGFLESQYGVVRIRPSGNGQSLNELYRRVIYRNNTLTDLLTTSKSTPGELVMCQEKLVQEAVDTLLDNGIRGQPMTDGHNKVYKSFSDVIEGKEGRFRETLLGKRVDHSGRSVIVE